MKPQTFNGDLANLPKALALLTLQRRWVVWRWELRPDKNGGGKWTKPPFQAIWPSEPARSNDPRSWGSYEDALNAVSLGEADGIGYMLLDDDSDAGDLDHCRDPETGMIDPWAQALVDEAQAAGAYKEVTVSGGGLRIICRSRGTPLHRRWPVEGRVGAGFEAYRRCARYITISGLEIGSCDALPESDLIDRFAARFDSRANGASSPDAAQQSVAPGLDLNAAGPQFDVDDIIMNGAPEGQRSEMFMRCIAHLAAMGLTVDEIEARLAQYPNGIAAKYGKRLRREITRCFAKWEAPHNGPAGGHAGAPPPPPGGGTHGTAGAGAPPPVGPRVIRIEAGEAEHDIGAIDAAVVAAGRGLYRRAGKIVRICDLEMLGADETRTTTLAILDQSVDAVIEDVSAAAQFEKYSKREKKWLRIDPPIDRIKAWVARGSRLGLPILSAVTSTPLILRTGRIINKPGYDAATGFYFNPLGTIFPPIKARPTKQDAVIALAMLNELIDEFPFVDDASRAVALSGLLTSVARRSLDFAFMHGITAPSFGSGKSYLAKLFCVIATGRPPPVIAHKREEEFEKHLDACLLKGVGHLAIDNVSRPLGGDKLSQILSEPFCAVRPLGVSDDVTTPPSAFVTATGVNLAIVEDIRRRSLLCSLDARMERPELRKFRKDPIKTVLENRGEYVVAALTIIRAFMQSGEADEREPVNGFALYCAMVRAPLTWLGCADPCATMEAIREQDSTLGTMLEIARRWREVLDDREKTALEVAATANERGGFENALMHPAFHAALVEVALDGKMISSKRLAYWLRKRKGQRFSLALPDPDIPGMLRDVPHWFDGKPDRIGNMRWSLKRA